MLAATPRSLGLDVDQLDTYYRQVADWILPHVVDRPLGLLRSLGEYDIPFFQKHAKSTSPPQLARIQILEGNELTQHLAISDRDGLLALPAIEALEIHTSSAKHSHLERPDRMIFDLDPAPDVSWAEVLEAVGLVRIGLGERSLVGFPMLTGSRGIHVICPLVPQASWSEVRAVAEQIVVALAARYPSRFTMESSMSDRAGRIFIDYFHNDYGATSIAPYSTRARRGRSVAAPMSWDELSRTQGPGMYDVRSMPERLRWMKRDPWEEFWKIQQSV